MSKSVFKVSKTWLYKEHVATKKKLYGPRMSSAGIMDHFINNSSGHHAREQKSIASRLPHLYIDYSIDFNRDFRNVKNGAIVSVPYWTQVLPGLSERQRLLLMLISSWRRKDRWQVELDLDHCTRLLSDRNMKKRKDRQDGRDQLFKEVAEIEEMGLIRVVEMTLDNKGWEDKLIIEVLPKWEELRQEYRYTEGRKHRSDIFAHASQTHTPRQPDPPRKTCGPTASIADSSEKNSCKEEESGSSKEERDDAEQGGAKQRPAQAPKEPVINIEPSKLSITSDAYLAVTTGEIGNISLLSSFSHNKSSPGAMLLVSEGLPRINCEEEYHERA